jgi:hypothetical protein
MEKVAFITYNSVGDGLPNGWHGANGRRALVLQNTKGMLRAVDPKNPPKDSKGSYRPCGDLRRNEIAALWTELQKSLAELDHLVVYVGAGGSEEAIRLAAALPASKVTFVACDCNLPYKELLIMASGLDEAGRVLCECGGRETMNVLLDTFMATGSLLSA